MNEPFFVGAFAGWGDASNVATTCAAFLLQKREVTREIEFAPDEYFVLTETRPWVRLGQDGERRIQWPTLAVMRGAGDRREASVLIGPEPQLRWKSFVGEVTGYWRRHGQGDSGPGPVVLLGAFLAGVSHSAPVTLTGFATTPELRDRLAELGIQSSGYEGPTSCHSVLAEGFKNDGVPCVSIWAAVPHYVGSMPNPKACAAILRAVDNLLDLGLDLQDLDDAAETFEKQVSLAVAKSGQMLALASGTTTPEQPAEDPGPLPSNEDVLKSVEDILRRSRDAG